MRSSCHGEESESTRMTGGARAPLHCVNYLGLGQVGESFRDTAADDARTRPLHRVHSDAAVIVASE